MPYLLTLILALLLSAFSAVADYFANRGRFIRRLWVTKGIFQQFSGFLRSGNGGSGGRGGDIGSYNHTTYNHIVMNGVGIDAIHNISVQMATIETRVRELENRVRELESNQRS
ncbi:hypothetical protein CPB84DRAFT_1752034 [Gymnopilus junonius]|uniref:Uncharacterized protein n=1 Tax=Gymnopilus junonius TaxID=109634 RepID=A0A9P5NBW8_GYMJU|nr:hypothetical protein CPB84DRAFT_1752034 [Gymnopilus junonius]